MPKNTLFDQFKERLNDTRDASKDLFNKNINKYAIIIRSIGWIIIFICVAIILHTIHNTIKRNYNFNGIVENITYDPNRNPVITIKGVEYELSYSGWNDGWDIVNNKVEVGDKMIKKKGEMELLLIKHNGRDTTNLLYNENSTH